jgi:capsular polysaccharide biosynthesis protein
MNADIQKKYDDSVTLEARTLWRIFRHNWFVILVFAVIFAFAGFGAGQTRTTVAYTGKLDFVVNAPYGPNQPGVDADSQADSIETLIQDSTYYYKEKVHLGSVKASQLADFRVSPAHGDNNNAYTHVLTLHYTGSSRKNVEKAMQVGKKAVLNIPIQNLNTVDSVRTQHYKINRSVHSPAKKYAAAGALLGLVLSAGYLCIRVLGDSHYRNVRQLEEHLEIPVLGNIPTASKRRKK